MTPDEIYLRAVAAKIAEPAPAYVSYRADVRARGARLVCTDGRLITTFGSESSSQSYRVSFRGADSDASSIDLASDRPCAGVPLIAATGGDLAAAVTLSQRGSSGPEIAPALPVIGTVRVSSALHYRIESANVETLGDAAVFHLALHAVGDRVAYPLTDLFVDVQTYSIRRVVATFVDRFGGVPATIVASGTFAREGGYRVQIAEHVSVSAPTQPAATSATFDATASDFTYSLSP